MNEAQSPSLVSPIPEPKVPGGSNPWLDFVTLVLSATNFAAFYFTIHLERPAWTKAGALLAISAVLIALSQPWRREETKSITAQLCLAGGLYAAGTAVVILAIEYTPAPLKEAVRQILGWITLGFLLGAVGLGLLRLLRRTASLNHSVDPSMGD